MLITYIDLREFLDQGEDLYREFKSKLQGYHEEVGRTLSAYANDLNWAGGRYVFFGVDNHGTAIGTDEDFDNFQREGGEKGESTLTLDVTVK